MKIFLPKYPKTSYGFTLIELLVVVSIIAILAVIGMSVFSGAQGSARDGRRRVEISNIAKSIEGAKDFTSGSYKYGTADATKDFPRGVPNDPTTGVNYCVSSTNTSSTPPTAAATNWTSGCPTTGGYAPLATSISNTANNNLGATTGDVKAWTVCTALERGSTPYCVSSLTQ